MTAFTHYGISKFQTTATEVERHAEAIRRLGYALIPGLLPESKLCTYREALDRAYERQVQEMAPVGPLDMVQDAWIARCLLAEDPIFLELATHPTVLAVVEAILGDYFILQLQNGIINRPDVVNYQTAWHRDLSYQHFTSSRPLAVNVLFCLDPFSDETGGTVLIPASHHQEAFPSEAFVTTQAIGVTAPPGTAILMDAMVYHRAGFNRSQQIRRAVNHVYTLPFIKQQIRLRTALAGRYADDPFLSRLLGYDSDPDDTVYDWRLRRFQRRGMVP